MSKAIRTYRKKPQSSKESWSNAQKAPERSRSRQAESTRSHTTASGDSRSRQGDQARSEKSLVTRSDKAVSESSVSAGRTEKFVTSDVDSDAAPNSNANSKPYVRKIDPNLLRSPEPEEKVARDTGNVEDWNNHGCVSFSSRPPSCPPNCGPRNPLVCCSSRPNVIKVLAKLIVFLLVLISVFYSLFRVASGWNRRHEILTLLLFLLSTRAVCKKNWFLPAQYWRHLDPACDLGPKQVDVTVSSFCPGQM